MQTILGAGGAIGTELAKSLKYYTSSIRLVARNPKKVNDTDELVKADLLLASDVDKAIEGSTICYLVVGLLYNTKLWQEKWPLLIKNVVDACIKHNCKLVFFDNIYAIGGDNVKHISETSPVSPCSKKGEVRAEVDKIVLDAINSGKLSAIIARAPDFFGPIKETSMLMIMVYDNLKKGKKAQWLCNANLIHSTGYAPELAKGTAMLGNDNLCYNQIWNLPVCQDKITGQDWVNLFATELKASNKISVLPSFGLKILGWFIPVLGEVYEMRYQYDRDYFFDSTKFNNHFKYTPISNKQAVLETLKSLE
jgi:nucleoside-diphosphate-sugar epimerase